MHFFGFDIKDVHYSVSIVFHKNISRMALVNTLRSVRSGDYLSGKITQTISLSILFWDEITEGKHLIGALLHVIMIRLKTGGIYYQKSYIYSLSLVINELF